MGIKMSFLGGAGSIGASSTLVEVDGTTVAIDFGIRFQPDRPLPDLSVLQDKNLDAILVTHAHSDHTGGLPVVHSAFSNAPIYITPPTYDLVRILQKDALKLMNLEEREKEIPLYSEDQVQGMLEAYVPAKYNSTFEVGCIKATYLPAGHILGAAMIHLETPYGHMLFSGDYSVRGQLTVPNLSMPRVPVDMLVTETTYGNRLHEDRKASEKRLVQSIREVIERKGRVLIPAFAIGRAQEILMILKRAIRDQKLPEIPVHVDGMVRAVCNVYGRHPWYVSKPLLREIQRSNHAFFDDQIKPVDNKKRATILNSDPCIIIASSGMLSGGASMFYAQQLVGNEKDAIFITGYQDEESPGRKLLNLAANGGKGKINLGDKEYEVKCQFGSYGLSAHADKSEILGLVERMNPKAVVLVHGDENAKINLQASLGKRDIICADEGLELTREYRPRKVVWPSKASSLKAMPTTLEVKELEKPLIYWSAPKSALLQQAIIEDWKDIEFNTKLVGLLHTSSVSLKKDGKLVQSNTFKFKDRKDAEAMASQDILEKLLVYPDDAEDAKEISDHEIKMIEGNPKGKVLELLQKHKIEPPEFYYAVHPQGFIGSLTIILGNEKYEGKSYVASTSKNLEKFCYFKVVEVVENFVNDLKLKIPETPNNQPTKVIRPNGSEHPRSKLNELQQKKIIDNYGFEEVGRSGPSHAPKFKIKGWYIKNDKEVCTDPVESLSKKDAILLASSEMLETIQQSI